MCVCVCTVCIVVWFGVHTMQNSALVCASVCMCLPEIVGGRRVIASDGNQDTRHVQLCWTKMCKISANQ